MTKPLYLFHAYQQEIDAIVTQVGEPDTSVILDQTIFYAAGGGQPHDEGAITKGNETFSVIMVKKTPEGILHQVDKPGLQQGDKVHLTLDWKRRYILMRYHTAAHLVSAVFHQEAGAEITGNQMETDKGRIDFSLDDFSREKIDSFITKANHLIQQDAPVKVYTISKEEALKDSTLFKLAIKDYIEKLDEVRIVEIEGIDKQADGGTHVNSLKEIGAISLLKTENKGKNNRRIYFTIS